MPPTTTVHDDDDGAAHDDDVDHDDGAADDHDDVDDDDGAADHHHVDHDDDAADHDDATTTTVPPTTTTSTTTTTTTQPPMGAPTLSRSTGGCAAGRCEWTLRIAPASEAARYDLTSRPAAGSEGACSALANTCVVSFPASQTTCYSVEAVDDAGRISPPSNEVCLPD